MLKSKGFSLFEIVAAGLLLSAIVVIFLNVLLFSKKAVSISKRHEQALKYCQFQTERLRSEYRFDDAALAAGTHAYVPVPTELGSDYEGEWGYEIEDIDDNTDGSIDYKRITVHVRWTD